MRRSGYTEHLFSHHINKMSTIYQAEQAAAEETMRERIELEYDYLKQAIEKFCRESDDRPVKRMLEFLFEELINHKIQEEIDNAEPDYEPAEDDND